MFLSVVLFLIQILYLWNFFHFTFFSFFFFCTEFKEIVRILFWILFNFFQRQMVLLKYLFILKGILRSKYLVVGKYYQSQTRIKINHIQWFIDTHQSSVITILILEFKNIQNSKALINNRNWKMGSYII